MLTDLERSTVTPTEWSMLVNARPNIDLMGIGELENMKAHKKPQAADLPPSKTPISLPIQSRAHQT